MARLNNADAVFEGGGVKGIGLVGAVEYMEEAGLQLQNVVGTSAGAIVASLVAAGYSAAQLRDIMGSLEYRRFKDKSILDRLPVLGPVLSVFYEKGLYEGNYFENWLRKLLAESPRKVRTFRDLHMEGETPDSKYFYRLQVIAADLTRRKKLVLPWDISDYYDCDPENLDVARAVRMSMSLPFFFEPVQEKDKSGQTCFIVDGGVLSNFPVDILDDGKVNPPWPTFGFKLVDRVQSDGQATEEPSHIGGPISLLKAMFSTMMEAHDARYIQKKNFDRTIAIPTLKVETTDFNIRPEQTQALHRAGREAARQFIQKWDFKTWIEKHRLPEVLGQKVANDAEPLPVRKGGAARG